MKISENEYYVYAHKIPNSNKIFYIGVGKANRILETRKAKRSEQWTKQYEKTGLVLEILEVCNNRKQALKQEMFHIKKAKLKHPLVNKTDGGLGCSGLKPWNAGKKNPFSSETLEKLSKAGKRQYQTRKAREEQSKRTGGKLFIAKTIQGQVVWRGINQSECARFLKLNQGNIAKCLHGRLYTYKGYTFSFLTEGE